MELVLDQGRPASQEGRLAKELRSYDLLDSLGVDYLRVDHPAATTMADCQAVDAVLDAMICKNLFLCNRQQTAFYLLLIPQDKRFQTKALSKALGVARLSFAGEEQLADLMDLTPGSVSVLGLMNDRDKRVQLVIDRDVLKADHFACHPCINTSSLRMTMADFQDKLLPGLGHPAIYVDLPQPEEEPETAG